MNKPDNHANLLLIEDHRQLAETIGAYLENQNFIMDYAADGLTGLHLAVTNHYDAIILDLMLPGIDGLQVAEKLRNEAHSDTPILMLTARDQLEDKLVGFEKGADDYLVKPFDMPELEARLHAIIRRQRGEFDDKLLTIADLSLNTKTMEVMRNNQKLKLTPTGIRILRILMRESPNVVSREDMESELWGDVLPDSDTLRSHIYNLRKVVDKPFDVQLIHTLPGIGLKLALN